MEPVAVIGMMEPLLTTMDEGAAYRRNRHAKVYQIEISCEK